MNWTARAMKKKRINKSCEPNGERRHGRSGLRSSHGTVLVELACSSIFLVIFAIFAVYLTLIITCANITDKATRDAARAAAEQQTQAKAMAVAQSIVLSFASANPFMTPPTVPVNGVVYQDYGGNPPALKSPFVTVTVVSSAKLPFAPAQFFGQTFGTDTYTFSQTYTFPIVNTK